MRRRGRRFRWAPLAALAAVAGLAIVAIVLRSGPETGAVPAPTAVAPSTTTQPPLAVAATDAAEIFVTAWQERDWSALESIVGADGENAPSEHAAWWNDLAVSSLQLSLVDVSGENGFAVATYDVAVGVADLGEWTYRSSVQLMDGRSGWQVRWQPAALHPSLQRGDHLELKSQWPDRGPILDTAGTALVSRRPSVMIGVVPGRIESRDELAAALQAHLEVAPDELFSILDRP